jgi:exodeoxyribonuclease VII large subunit
MEKVNLQFSVSDFVALTNQTLEYAYPSVEIEGEVAGFKVNQGKFVFFDLKDAGASVGCFMMVFQLRVPIEDGMKVVVTATPKLTQWGKFSLTVRAIRPSGEGSLKKSFDLLKAKLEKEGLFAPERKRALPYAPTRVAVISSTQAAGYADFMKIANDRWGGVRFTVAQVQVHGAAAPDQMIRALRHFNEQEVLPEVIVIIRGGGSADDLSAFNDELLVREIATSRVPTLVGVGHEVDISLADLAADLRAATPSNAAQLLLPDRHEMIRAVRYQIRSLVPKVEQSFARSRTIIREQLERCLMVAEYAIEQQRGAVDMLRRVLGELDPNKVLARGYAIVRGKPEVGHEIIVETQNHLIRAEVKSYDKK